MGRLLAIALAVAAAGIAVVAVNGPGIDKPEEKDVRAPQAQSSEVAHNPDRSGEDEAGAPVGATVLMKRLAFGPATSTLRTGQSVRFVNKDNVTHTVIQDFGPRSGLIPQVESERIPPGEDYTFIARTEGEIDYVCTLHPTVMTGRLVVSGAAA